jgi:hypothetical protein
MPSPGDLGLGVGSAVISRTPIEVTAGTGIANALYQPYDVRRYGADQTGVADSAPAFNASPNVTFAYPGTYLTNSIVTAGKPVISFNASFTGGATALNAWMPNFGANDFTVMEFLGGNAIVGAVQNNLGAVPLSTVAITGIAGQFSCAAGALVVGMQVLIAGTLGGTGSITGYTNPTPYKISVTNGSTTFTLTTLTGSAIVTTAGTPTGLTYNTSPAGGTANFPTGTTGYGRTNSMGNSVFGLFGQADLWSTGNAVGAELDSFNYAASPGNAFPPNLGFGTAGFNAIASLVAAYGNFPSLAGLMVAQGSQTFQAGIYVHPQACSTYGMLIDANASSTMTLSQLVKHKVGVQAVQFQGVGTPVPGNNVILYVDGSSATKWGLQESGSMFFAYASAGWGTPTGNAAVSAFPGATATLLQTSTAVAQIIVMLKSLGLATT